MSIPGDILPCQPPTEGDKAATGALSASPGAGIGAAAAAATSTNAGTAAGAGGSILVEQARQVLQMEADAILGVSAKLTEAFDSAIHLLMSCTGKVVVTGVGKSGHIGS